MIKKLILISLAFVITSCEGGPIVSVSPTPGLPGDLQDQLDRTQNSNVQSARNALVQARVIYGQLAGRWNSINPIDAEAFAETREKLLPPMFIVANSLTSDTSATGDKADLTRDFRELYYDSLTHMLRGINNNLTVYQAFLENSQIINATNPDKTSGFPMTDEAITTLAGIFQATEITELYVAQLGAFGNTSAAPEDTQRLLNGIKNQQTTIINGIINYTTQNLITLVQARKAYAIIVRSLTSPTLLNALGNLAITVFGKDNVAFRQDELTSAQPNPNMVVMVIREENTVYRLINIENGRVVNRVSNDSRGLSAADLLFQSNVNVVKVQP